MHAVADTDKLVEDGVITEDQAREIESRARETMVEIGINTILTVGILAATFGLIFWLANAISVAVFGSLALVLGFVILAYGGDLYRIFGNAASLIGAGMLLGGAGFELIDKYEDIAGWVMLFAGPAVVGLMLASHALTIGFVTGAILLMGVGMHLTGLGVLLIDNEISGIAVSLSYFYAAVVVAAAGWWCDVRFVTALAIIPFAQLLDTGTAYFHAAYVFYSPEPTLSILQMLGFVALGVWATHAWPERSARHARILTILAFVVANLCALVGSLWGDYVGETIWGPSRSHDQSWSEHRALLDAFRESTLHISADAFTILWAVALVAAIVLSAIRANRGLFNAAMTFGAIHAYTQIFESFADEPLAYVIGGLAAIPLAWGIWRLNGWIVQRNP